MFRRTDDEENAEYDYFVDRNIYCYREDGGVIKFRGIILGPGWENHRFRPDKLICYREKGDEIMGRKRKLTPPEPQKLKELWEESDTINAVAGKLGTSWAQAKTWLVRADIIDSFGRPKETKCCPSDNDATEKNLPPETHEKKLQAPNPEPVTAANQEPEEGEWEPDGNSVAWGAPFDEELSMSPGEALSRGRTPYIKPEDVDMSNVPREAWEEDYDVKEQIESWVMDLWRMDINKARKLRLLESLLDMGVTEC